MPESDIRHLRLDRLEPSATNVRKTPTSQAAFDELKASIAAHGLLENRVVTPIDPGPDDPERYAVIAGSRRQHTDNHYMKHTI